MEHEIIRYLIDALIEAKLTIRNRDLEQIRAERNEYAARCGKLEQELNFLRAQPPQHT